MKKFSVPVKTQICDYSCTKDIWITFNHQCESLYHPINIHYPHALTVGIDKQYPYVQQVETLDEMMKAGQDVFSGDPARSDVVSMYPLDGYFNSVRCDNFFWVVIKRKEKKYTIMTGGTPEKCKLDFDDTIVVFERPLPKDALETIIPPFYKETRISYAMMDELTGLMEKHKLDAKVFGVFDHSANESSTITIKSTLNAVSMTIDLVKNKVLKYHYDKIWKIETVLHEALVNAITYGNELDYTKPVVLSYEIGYKGMRLWVRDMGDGFDVDNIAVPMGNESLDRISGRGIYIMKKFSEAFFFNKKGNEMLLFFEF
ncbi:MAG: ATP-binding protein [Brevinematales bacterium]|nr:ATP-binding protein [Brevinematales bacterium]